MKRAVLDNNDNPIVEKIRKEDGLDYSEELKLNIACDEDDQHIAVLYCLKCETSLCKICADSIHSRKTLADHQIVRLTEKPEPPIYCVLHPLEIAKLICNEPNCDGINKPMCTMCHQYGKHKDHNYEILDDAFDQIRQNVTNCLKNIGGKQAICDRSLKKYESCLLTYNGDYVKSKREEIDRFYSDARTSALELYDDFVKSRSETLEKLKNRCINDKLKFDDINTKIGNIDKMAKKDIIECGDDVKELMKQSEKKTREPKYLIPAQYYNIAYPYDGFINLKIDISKNIQLQNQQKIHAVYFVNLDYFCCEAPDKLGMEEITSGELFTFTGGRTILELKKAPTKRTTNSSLYKYIAVVACFKSEGFLEVIKIRLDETTPNTCWVRIIALMMAPDWKSDKEYADKILELTGVDKRIEIVNYQGHSQLIRTLLQD